MGPNNVYICDGIRTPIGRFAGALAAVRPDDMLAHCLRQLLSRNNGLDPAAIDEVIMGCANQAGEDNRNVARMSALLAGLPVSVPAITVNRLCASGLDAVIMAARGIACGEMDLALAGGVESMSRAPFVLPKAEHAYGRQAEIYDTTIGWRFVNAQLKQLYGTDSMPETAENVASKYNISRADQDAFAARSQARAESARAHGWLAEEIAPVHIPQRKGDDRVVSEDEHPRPGTSAEQLARLPAPFREGGCVTAGNASGVNDGACALVLAGEAALESNGLQPLARVLGAATHGVDPALMGIGPVPACEKLLKRAAVSVDDLDVIELNEAFAAQSLAVLRQLGIADDDARVNAQGGAIALGHPLGMSGARLVLSAVKQLQRKNGKLALCTLCVGVGQGVALLLERIQ